MSAKSRCKNHNRIHKSKPGVNRQTAASSLNSMMNEISSLTQQLSPASPFETEQLQNLQTMIEHLALQVLSTIKQKDQTNSNAAMPLLRVYAQYLNLYMKFKDLCFKQNHTKSTTPPNTEKPAPLPQPVVEVFHPVNENLSRQIQKSIQQISHNNNHSQPQSAANINGLLIPPSNGSQ